tara:strand:- start:471 stop:620 length:150 start_codon:yes stop_codon:yes gene_type:complete
MKINEALWAEVRKRIEKHIEADENITDVTIKCKVQESEQKNYLQLNLTF